MSNMAEMVEARDLDAWCGRARRVTQEESRSEGIWSRDHRSQPKLLVLARNNRQHFDIRNKKLERRLCTRHVELIITINSRGTSIV